MGMRLGCHEHSFLVTIYWYTWPIPYLGVFLTCGVGVQPEYFMKPTEDALDRGLIGVTCQKWLEGTGINSTHNFEQLRMVLNCPHHDLISKGCSRWLWLWFCHQGIKCGPISSSPHSQRRSCWYDGCVPELDPASDLQIGLSFSCCLSISLQIGLVFLQLH